MSTGWILLSCITHSARFEKVATPSPISPIDQRIEHVIGGLSPKVSKNNSPADVHTLSERMTAMHIRGVSIAVIHNGSIEWARGFGTSRKDGTPVNPDTLFQAGSISKPVAAMAALHLVMEGKLSLDADVNDFLVSWKMPASEMADGASVTLRELLTHTGGMSVHGFSGYAAKTPVPTLLQVLNGEKPANSPPIRIMSRPGTAWSYSGGGYTVVQQVLIDASHEAFPKLMWDVVLAPIGMIHSTYEQPLPTHLKSLAASPYDDEGDPIRGGAHTYPEMAAAGLWTTPSDLARYILEIQTSLIGKSNHVLSPELTRAMLAPGLGDYGMGLHIEGSSESARFNHGGVNEGFESYLVGYESTGEGAVVMTNGEHGSVLAEEIIRSIAAEYHWPGM